MDDTGSARSLGAAPDGPGAGFLRSCGEIGDEVEKLVTGADQAVETRFLKVHAVQIFLGFLIGKLCNFCFDCSRNDDRLRALFVGHLVDGSAKFVALGGVAFCDVADIKNRLGGQKVQALQRQQVFCSNVLQHQADRLAVLEQFECRFHHRQNGEGFLVLAGGALADLNDAAFDTFKVRKHQLRFNRLGVRYGIDTAFDMGDVIVLEAAQHMHDGIHLADIRQELVAQPLPARGAAHEAGNVHEVDAGRDDFLRTCDLGNLVLARIGNRHFAGVRLNGAERIVCGLCGGRFGQRVEKRRLANIWQTDDAAFETHDRTYQTRILLLWLCVIGP